MKRELEKYGLQLPAFSKIGGILAKELSVDEAAGDGCPQMSNLGPALRLWRSLIALPQTHARAGTEPKGLHVETWRLPRHWRALLALWERGWFPPSRVVQGYRERCLRVLPHLPAAPVVHAAVLAINQAVEQGVVAQTMGALRNPSAMLLGLRQELAGAYQEMLHRAKLEKGSNARNRVRAAPGGMRGVAVM